LSSRCFRLADGDRFLFAKFFLTGSVGGRRVLRTHTARYGVQVAIAGKLETVCPRARALTTLAAVSRARGARRPSELRQQTDPAAGADPLGQLSRSGRRQADPVPESVAATAPNRKSLKWNRRRRRRRPHHRAASSRCTAQAARAGRAAARLRRFFYFNR